MVRTHVALAWVFRRRDTAKEDFGEEWTRGIGVGFWLHGLELWAGAGDREAGSD